MMFVVVGCLNAQSSFISVQSNQRWMDLLLPLIISFLLRSFVCLFTNNFQLDRVCLQNWWPSLPVPYSRKFDWSTCLNVVVCSLIPFNQYEIDKKIAMMWRLWRRYCVERKIFIKRKMTKKFSFYRISAGFDSCLPFFVSSEFIYFSFSLLLSTKLKMLRFVVPCCVSACVWVFVNISLLPNPHVGLVHSSWV